MFHQMLRVNPAKTGRLARFSLNTGGYNLRTSSPFSSQPALMGGLFVNSRQPSVIPAAGAASRVGNFIYTGE